MAGHLLNQLAPNREALSAWLGAPMDGVAWTARQLGAKGIPGEMGQPDPIVQVMDTFTVSAVLRPHCSEVRR
jgi:hypothetical protein